MKKTVNPLGFINLDDKLEGRFLNLSSSEHMENDGGTSRCGTIAWPLETSKSDNTDDEDSAASGEVWN